MLFHPILQLLLAFLLLNVNMDMLKDYSKEKTKTRNIELDNNGYRKFGIRDKVAYAAGDFRCNMSFALKSYLMIYWTQYMAWAKAFMRFFW